MSLYVCHMKVFNTRYASEDAPYNTLVFTRADDDNHARKNFQNYAEKLKKGKFVNLWTDKSYISIIQMINTDDINPFLIADPVNTAPKRRRKKKVTK